jgi:hypothetical protein
MPDPDSASLVRLEADGLISLESGEARTTRRFQAAMARAASQLLALGTDCTDLRIPIAFALVAFYGVHDSSLGDAEIGNLVEALLPIELAELDPRARLARAASEHRGSR